MEIRAENIGVSFENQIVLENLSFYLPQKELVMLIGPNGSGKTTLMRVLMGFEKPAEGEIFYDEMPLKEMKISNRSRLMAYMSQHPGTTGDDMVLEYVLLGVTPHLNYFSLPGRKHREMAEEILKELGLWEKREQKISTLSGGERQIANFAKARIQNTPWMLLDEPMASLDFNRQHEFMKLLTSYQKTYGQGIFMSIHDPNLCLKYGQKVLVMGNHKILGAADRRDGSFSTYLMELLNQSYGSHLNYIGNETGGYYDWKEAEYVSG